MRDTEDAEETFRSLMALSGCSSILRLREGERGRGLFTDGAVNEGETLLTVPLSACLVEHRGIPDEEAEKLLGRPLSQVSDPAAFTWDIRLALQLLAHTGKIQELGGTARTNSEFWERYVRVYVRMHVYRLMNSE